MGLKTLASGTTEHSKTTLYQAPVGKWASISRVRLVNPTGNDVTLRVVQKNAGQESLLTPANFIFKAGYKIEFDTIALHPGSKIYLDSGARGISFSVTGEERFSE